MQIINKLKLFFQFLYLVYIVFIDVAIVMFLYSELPDIVFYDLVWFIPIMVISTFASIYQIKLIRSRKSLKFDSTYLNNNIKDILFSKKAIAFLISYLLNAVVVLVFAIIFFTIFDDEFPKVFLQQIFLIIIFVIGFASLYDGLLVIFYIYPKLNNRYIFKSFKPTKKQLLNLVLILVVITQISLFVYSSFNNPVSNIEIIDKYDDGSIKKLKYFPDIRIKNLFLLREYYNSGNLKSKVIVEDDYLSGVKKEYYENGILRLEEVCRNRCFYNSTCEDAYVKYYNKKGILIKEYHILNGQYHGKLIQYDSLGNLNSILYFNKGKFNGTQKEFYPNGKLFNITNFNEDKMDGYHCQINYNYPDTDIVEICEGYYKYNERDSIWKWRDKDSNLFAVERYSLGKLDGEQEHYHYNGQKSFVRYYVKDNYYGEVRAYDINGVQTMDSGKGVDFRYFNNGNIKAELSFKDSVLNGVSKYYYENGSLGTVERYRDDEYINTIESYDSLGVRIK